MQRKCRMPGWLAIACIAGAMVTILIDARPARSQWVTERDKLWKVVDGALVEAGKLAFSDGFDHGPKLSPDWRLDGALAWRVEDGVLANTGYGATATLSRDLGEGFVVEVKVKPLALEPGKDGGFTGVEAGGVLFVLQPGRWWWMYRREGETRSAGNWKTEPVPLDNWYQFKIVRQPGGVFSWYVDGRLIVNLVEPAVKGGLALRGWRFKAAYADVKVYSLVGNAGEMPGGAGAVNLLRNGSFEHFEDQIPPFWSPTRFREIPILFGSLEAFRDSWTVDSSQRKDGAVSMRLGGEKPNGLQSYYINVRPGRPCVLSAWLKSDAPTMSIALAVSPGASRVVEADRQWKRYSLTVTNPVESRVRVGISTRSPGRVWVDAVQLEEGAEPTAFRPNPLDNQHPWDNRGAAINAEARLARRATPPKAPALRPPVAVEANVAPRCLRVDGKPLFVFAPLQTFHVPTSHPYGNYDATIETMMSYWAANGFKTIMVGANIDAEKGGWGQRIFDKTLSYADTTGMKVVGFWTGPWNSVLIGDHPRLDALLKRWRHHHSLLAWQVADEPEIYSVKPEDVAKGVRLAKQCDPDHPIYINYTQVGPGRRYAGLPGDILSLDYYLTSVEGRTIAETLRLVDEMETLARPRGIPTWNFIIGSFPDHHCREISADEQTAQTYGNVIKGASGLAYFVGQPMGLKHWARLKQLNAELQELTPVLFSAERTGLVSVSEPAILATVRRLDGKTYLLAVNIEGCQTKAEFDLSGVMIARDGKVKGKTLFENRPIEISRGRLSDSFQPYQRHVYELDEAMK